VYPDLNAVGDRIVLVRRQTLFWRCFVHTRSASSQTCSELLLKWPTACTQTMPATNDSCVVAMILVILYMQWLKSCVTVLDVAYCVCVCVCVEVTISDRDAPPWRTVNYYVSRAPLDDEVEVERGKRVCASYNFDDQEV
jgi:hypothetical protein